MITMPIKMFGNLMFKHHTEPKNDLETRLVHLTTAARGSLAYTHAIVPCSAMESAHNRLIYSAYA